MSEQVILSCDHQSVRCHKTCLFLLFAYSLLVSGLLLYVYEPTYVVWTANNTYGHAIMRLHAHTLTQVPCDTTCGWLREQHRRKQRVSTTCSSYRNSTERKDVSFTLTPELLKQMNHFLVLDSHKLIYCYIPKVGCTNWKRIFLVLRGIMQATNRTTQFETHVRAAKHIRTLATYSLKEANERLTNYTKFMFVRHPFERLISGYRDKFLMDYPSSTIFRKRYGRKISAYGGPKRPPLRPDGTLNVSFGQFIRYVGDPANTFRSDDPTEHWNEMYRMCHPCLVHYDILGNFSTLHVDADFVLHAKGLDSEISYPKSTNPTNSSDETYMSSYFEDVPPSNIEALLTRYAIDFDLFGYTVPPSIQTMLNDGKTMVKLTDETVKHK